MANVIEIVIRGTNELGPALQDAERQIDSFAQRTARITIPVPTLQVPDIAPAVTAAAEAAQQFADSTSQGMAQATTAMSEAGKTAIMTAAEFEKLSEAGKITGEMFQQLVQAGQLVEKEGKLRFIEPEQLQTVKAAKEGVQELGRAVRAAKDPFQELSKTVTAVGTATGTLEGRLATMASLATKVGADLARGAQVPLGSIASLQAALRGLEAEYSRLGPAQQRAFQQATSLLGHARAQTTELAAATTRLRTEVGGAGGAFSSVFGGLKGQLLGLVGGVLSITVAFNALKSALSAALANADKMRDLANAVQAVSASHQSAAAALEFFESAAKRTRQTGDELAKFYAQALPNALKMGFSEENFQRMVVSLSNFSTAVQKAPQEIFEAWKQLTSGRLMGTNAILQALGISTEDVQQGRTNIQAIVQGIGELAEKGAEMGQTLESAGAKIKDSLLDAFGEGFNRARGTAEQGMQGLVDTFSDPQLLQAITAIGEAVANIVPVIAGAITTIIETAQKMKPALEAVLTYHPVPAVIRYATTKPEVPAELEDALLQNLKRKGMAGDYAKILQEEYGQTRKAADSLAVSVKGLNLEFGKTDAQKAAARETQRLAQLYKQTTEALTAGTRDAETKLRALSNVMSRPDFFKTGDLEKAGALMRDLGIAVLQTKDAYISLGGVVDLTKSKFSTEGPGALIPIAGQEQTAASIEAEKDLLAKRQRINAEGAAETKRAMREAALDMNRQLKEAARDLRDRLLEGGRELANNFGGALTGIFSDLARTGGRNFGEIAGEALSRGLDTAAKMFADVVISALGGGEAVATTKEGVAGYTIGGQFYPGELKEAQRQRGEQIYGGIGQGLGGAMGLYSAIATPNLQSDVSTVLTGTLGGAALGGAVGGIIAGGLAGSVVPVIGTIIGAAVGLIAGAISAALSSVGDDYKYGIPQITDGIAKIVSTTNIRPQELAELEGKLQSTFDEFYSGYIRILLKFPEQLLPGILDQMDFGGKIQGAASANFLKHLDQYMSGTLPRDIAQAFKEPMQMAFVNLGFSIDRFQELWDKLDKLDPKKALDLWGQLADAAIAFDETMRFFSTPLQPTFRPGEFVPEPGLFSQVSQEMNQSFGQQLAETDEQIIRLGAALNELTGEAQIAAARELGQLMEERMAKEKAFLQSIIEGIDNIRKSFEASIRELTLEGMKTPEGKPDVQAQVEYLRDYAEQLRLQMMTATSPEAIQQLAGEIQQTILRIRQLGGTLGPEADEAYRKWAIQALQQVQEQAIARMNQLAEEVETANERFIDAIEGFIDAFLTATSQLTGDGTQPAPGPSPGPGGGGGGGGPDGGPRKEAYDVEAPGGATRTAAEAVVTPAEVTVTPAQVEQVFASIGETIAYLREHADALRQELRTTTDSAQVDRLAEEIRQTMLGIRQLGGTLGAEAEQTVGAYALEMIRRTQQTAQEQLAGGRDPDTTPRDDTALLAAIERFSDRSGSFAELLEAVKETNNLLRGDGGVPVIVNNPEEIRSEVTVVPPSSSGGSDFSDRIRATRIMRGRG